MSFDFDNLPLNVHSTVWDDEDQHPHFVGCNKAQPGTGSRTNKSRRNDQKPCFTIDRMVSVRLDLDFAADLGKLLLEIDTQDKRIKSFGHNLCNLVD